MYVYTNGDEDKVIVKYNVLSLLHIDVLIWNIFKICYSRRFNTSKYYTKIC